ncbi:hypothetical protein BS47DRAFT_1345871 [Hydnum rufescens UP504]|uniref:CCL2-like lectin domain-containing protein n=1 Tax=Hydnum rufescens UP504 TaxID=1448309 RepID=A0A9P6AU88_9AGAM|nr:hypothetical protein BS47DRAFT_1345871 [Hydnum rufescens UP504]
MATSYFIVNRELSADGQRLTVQFDGLGVNLTMVPLDTNNTRQHWSISPDGPSTIVLRDSPDVQALPSQGFVIGGKQESSHLWTFNTNPPGPGGLAIEDSGEAIWGVETAGIQQVILGEDTGHFTQRWILQPVVEPLPK